MRKFESNLKTMKKLLFLGGILFWSMGAFSQTCAVVSGVGSSNPTSTTIELTWTAGGSETSWNIEYDAEGFTQGDGLTATATGTPTAILTDLVPAGTYDVYVQADCGNGDESEWEGPYTFTTPCVPVAINMFPWTENFDNTDLEALPCGWLANDVNGDETTWYVSNSSAASGANSLYIEWNSSEAMNDWAFTPELMLEAGTTYALSFDYSTENDSYIESMGIHIGNAQTVAAMTTLLNDIPELVSEDFTNHLVIFTVPTDGSYYIGFHGYSITNQYVINLDNITVDFAPACPTPTMLTASNFVQDGATISWNAGFEETHWTIEYGEQGFSPGDGTTITVQGTPDTIIGDLQPSTAYDYYVTANCDAATESDVAGPFTFTTTCIPPVVTDLPWVENFDAVATPELPCGWAVNDVNNDEITWYTQAEIFASESNALRIEYNGDEALNDWAYTPAFTLTAGTTYQLSFDYSTDDDWYDESMSVHIGNAQTTAAMTTSLAEMTAFYSIDFTTKNIVFTVPADGNYFVGFHAFSEANLWTIVLDNITMDLAPACPEVDELSVGLVTGNTASLSWSAGFSETTWNVEYGPEGFVPGEGTLITAHETPDTTIAGLNGLTTYDYYVQADCGAEDAQWVGPFTFTTPCVGPIISTYPWSEDFETAETPDMLCGWISENANDDFEEWETDDFISNSGDYALYMDYDFDNDMNDWVFTPAFVMQAGTTYKVSFAYAADYVDYDEKLKLAVGTSQTSAAMSTTLTDLTFNNETFDTVTVAFTPTVTGSYFFGVQAHSEANTSGIYVDDFHVCEAESASFTLAQDTICKTAAPIAPVVTGVTGGRFSGSTGLVVDATTGAIVPVASTVGTHQLTYTSSTGMCAGTSTMTVIIKDCTLGLDEAASLSAVELYPNPTNGIFNIRAPYAADLKIAVLDFTGKAIELPVAQQATGAFTVDLSNLSNGVYLVKLTNKEGQQIRRVVLNK